MRTTHNQFIQRTVGPHLRFFKWILKFVTTLLAMTLIFSVIWSELIAGRLYTCTDAAGFDYLQPGNWVHGHIVSVDHVVPTRSMSEADTIRRGWSLGGLWALWILCISTSLFASVFFAGKNWSPRIGLRTE